MFEVLRDFCLELNSREIPHDIRKIIEFQIRSVRASLNHGRKYLKEKGILEEFERNAEMLGFSDPIRSIFINTSASVIFDWDDYLFAGHTGHSSVITAIELTAKKEKSVENEKFLKAIWIGNEIGGRFGIATLLGPLNGQMMTYLHGIISSAITSYLIFGPEKIPERILNYISNPNFISFSGFMGGDTKIFTTSTPTISGIISALLEIKPRDSTLDDFLSIFSFGKNEHKVLEKIFSPDFFVTRTLMIKKYPACAYVLPQIECAISIKKEIEEICDVFDPKRIERIEVEYSIIPFVLDRISGKFSDFTNHVWSEFSSYTSLAFALLSPSSTFFPTPQELGEKKHEILSLVSKMEMKHNISYTIDTIKNVVEHFGFLADNLPSLFTLPMRNTPISQIPKSEVMKTALTLSTKVLPLILSKSKKMERKQPDEFTFKFPAKVRISYDGEEFEEKRETHMSPARADEIADVISFKENAVKK